MTSNTCDLKILATPIPTNKSPHVISYRSNKTIEKGDDRGEVPLNKFWSGKDPIIFHTQNNNISETLTLIDSGASDHCFVKRSFFALYSTLDNPPMGLSAGKESTFEITEKEKVEFLTNINDVQRKITFNNVLHTPGLRSNLISVSKLNSKGLYMTFGRDKA